MPEKAGDTFLSSLQINIKKARQIRFSNAGYVYSTQERVIVNPTVRDCPEMETCRLQTISTTQWKKNQKEMTWINLLRAGFHYKNIDQ